MRNRLFSFNFILLLIVCFAFFGLTANADNRFSDLEEQGLGDPEISKNPDTNAAKKGNGGMLLDVPVLLIPESTGDVVGMYDPQDGTYLGDLIDGSGIGFSTPINALPGPDGNIYVSDQLADAVFVFDSGGNYLYTYADATDGLNNIRGIDFRGDHLFVTSGDDYVAEFDGPHSRLADFINDGSDTFDILFLDDGRALVADIQGTTDNIRLYNADGTLSGELFSVNFPEQISADLLDPGTHLNAAFSANIITDFDIDGTIHLTTAFSAGRGVYRLGNGNLLATNGTGVLEIDPTTGAIIETENTGSGRFIELYVIPDASVPTLSEWGMIFMALLLVLFGTVAVIIRRRSTVTAKA